MKRVLRQGERSRGAVQCWPFALASMSRQTQVLRTRPEKTGADVTVASRQGSSVAHLDKDEPRTLTTMILAAWRGQPRIAGNRQRPSSAGETIGLASG